MRSVPAFRRVLTLRIGGQQPAADLRARGFELAFRDQTAGAVALYLGKLVAVDFNVRVPRAVAATPAFAAMETGRKVRPLTP